MGKFFVITDQRHFKFCRHHQFVAYPGFVLDDRPVAPALFDRAHAVPGLDFLPEGF